MNDVTNGGDYARVGAGCIWGISVPSSQFYYVPKNAIKINYF